MTEVALFPLSQIVLPQGRMKLRIFEPRYIRLVREACAGTRPFAIALLNSYVAQSHPDRIFAVATEVIVTDFTQLDDGLLGITVEGSKRVEIIKRWQEPDGLHVANIIELAQWPEAVLLPNQQQLARELLTVFEQNPSLQALYPAPKWENGRWLAQRWIEILTMPPPLKQQLMAAECATPTLEALTSWLQSQLQA